MLKSTHSSEFILDNFVTGIPSGMALLFSTSSVRCGSGEFLEQNLYEGVGDMVCDNSITLID